MLGLPVVTLVLLGLSQVAALTKRWSSGDAASGDVDPNVANGCTYWANSIAVGDSCADLQDFFGITVAQLVSWNPSLSSNKCELTVGWSYCVEAPKVQPTTSKTTTSTTKTTTASSTWTTSVSTTTTTSAGAPTPTQSGLIPTCNSFYFVEEGDYCEEIVSSFGNFTLDQFYSWNPAVQNDCSGLQAGYYVCVGVVGPPVTSSTTTKPATTLPATTTTSSNSPQQTGIAENCNKFYFVESGNTCAEIAIDNGITLSNFYLWNPAVGTLCNGLQAGYYVCVGVSGIPTTNTTRVTTSTSTATSGPSPTQSGISPDCTTYYNAQPGDSCWTIITEKYTYLTSALFYAWNPAVGSTCQYLQSGYYYCVATKDAAPMPDTISTCVEWHQIVSGDTCWLIESEYGITATQFGRWNPSVGASCESLWLGYFVCVGV
ncbi:hypothetical protein BJX70DRAFT_389455 [Aspergillus crustosus]